jgi:uncharacterized protein
MAATEAGRPSKRRSGPIAGGLPVAEARPVFADGAVQGSRCTACRHPMAQQGLPWCPICYRPVEPATFANTGAVWSSTVIAIPVGQWKPPFALAYVDLDDGPRVLVHLHHPAVVPIGTRVRITTAEHGDLLAAVEEKS